MALRHTISCIRDHMEFAYPACLESEPDGGYLVTFPDLPDAITQGDSRDDAIEMAADCLAETIGARIAERADIPDPSWACETRASAGRRSGIRRSQGCTLLWP